MTAAQEIDTSMIMTADELADYGRRCYESARESNLAPPLRILTLNSQVC